MQLCNLGGKWHASKLLFTKHVIKVATHLISQINLIALPPEVDFINICEQVFLLAKFDAVFLVNGIRKMVDKFDKFCQNYD